MLKTTCAIRELLGISCSLTLVTLTQRKTESNNSFQGHRFQHVRTILYPVNSLAYSTKAAITLSLVTFQEWTIMTMNHDGTCALRSCNASISKDNCLIKPRLDDWEATPVGHDLLNFQSICKTIAAWLENKRISMLASVGCEDGVLEQEVAGNAVTLCNLHPGQRPLVDMFYILDSGIKMHSIHAPYAKPRLPRSKHVLMFVFGTHSVPWMAYFDKIEPWALIVLSDNRSTPHSRRDNDEEVLRNTFGLEPIYDEIVSEDFDESVTLSI